MHRDSFGKRCPASGTDQVLTAGGTWSRRSSASILRRCAMSEQTDIKLRPLPEQLRYVSGKLLDGDDPTTLAVVLEAMAIRLEREPGRSRRKLLGKRVTVTLEREPQKTVVT